MEIHHTTNLEMEDVEAGVSQTSEREPQQKPFWKSLPQKLGIFGYALVVVIAWILVAVLCFVAFCVAVAVDAAMAAGVGAAMIVIGNAILRETGHHGYVANSYAGSVGAVGGIITNLIFSGAFWNSTNTDSFDTTVMSSIMVSLTLCGTLSGVIGCAILIHTHTYIGSLDVLHAARAGALGGVILSIPLGLIVAYVFQAAFWTLYAAYAVWKWAFEFRHEMRDAVRTQWLDSSSKTI